jgi:ankyrin repeat protein
LLWTALGLQRTVLQEGSDSNKCSALAIAARHGHHEAVSLLLGAGADVNHKDEVNTQMSLNGIRVEYAQLMTLECVVQNGYTALMFASLHAHSNAAQTLLEAQADVNAVNEVQHPRQAPLSMRGNWLLLRPACH